MLVKLKPSGSSSFVQKIWTEDQADFWPSVCPPGDKNAVSFHLCFKTRKSGVIHVISEKTYQPCWFIFKGVEALAEDDLGKVKQ